MRGAKSRDIDNITHFYWSERNTPAGFCHVCSAFSGRRYVPDLVDLGPCPGKRSRDQAAPAKLHFQVFELFVCCISCQRDRHIDLGKRRIDLGLPRRAARIERARNGDMRIPKHDTQFARDLVGNPCVQLASAAISAWSGSIPSSLPWRDVGSSMIMR